MNNAMISNNGDIMLPVEGNNSQIFENSEFGKLEVIVIDGKPWFLGKEIASALGYKNTSDAIAKHVDTEDKDGIAIRDSIGRMQRTPIVNESGLYSLILSSKLPAAKKFKRWVTSEVLPDIQRHSMYMTKGALEKIMHNPDSWIHVLTAYKEEKEKVAELESRIEEVQPLVTMAESIMDTDGMITIGDLAKILHQNGIDIGQHRLYQYMRDNGYLMKGGQSYNLPTQSAMQRGLFRILEKAFYNRAIQAQDISRTAQVTPKGQLYFVNLFLNNKAITEKEM